MFVFQDRLLETCGLTVTSCWPDYSDVFNSEHILQVQYFNLILVSVLSICKQLTITFLMLERFRDNLKCGPLAHVICSRKRLGL